MVINATKNDYYVHILEISFLLRKKKLTIIILLT